MRDGDIEPTVVPRNPLDVLAQQIVAMTASGDELKVPALHETVRRAYPFAELSRELLDSVLDMLDGRYPSEEFAELRPRIVWDRVEDTIRARGAAPSSSRSRTPAPSPTAASTACTCRTAAAWASWTRRWSTRRARARPSCSAPPPGASRRSLAIA